MKSENNPILSIGIDLGGTNIKAAICGSDGSLHYPVSIPTHARKGPEGVISQINRAVNSLLSRQRFRSLVTGIGIGAPGSIDHRRGLVLNPPNLPGWGKVHLADAVANRWGIPVRVENDANAATLGEAHFGAGKGMKSFIGITIGTGIGSGIVIDRRIVHGEKGYAGELGHTAIDYNGPLCNCGARGCVEAYVGAHHLVARTVLELREHPSSILYTYMYQSNGRPRRKRILTPKHISIAARHGDSFANATLMHAGEMLGVALANAANLLDITTFVVGGGIAAAGQPLFDGMLRGARRNVITPLKRRIRIFPAKLGNNAGVCGAAALWFD